jgi:hypothetical protein
MIMSKTINYIVWVGGERSWHRSYLAETEMLELPSEHLELSNEELYDLYTDWDKGHREELENGCCGWGPYTDQLLGVCKADDEDNPLCLIDIEEELLLDRTDYVKEFPKKKAIIAHHYEKGGWSGEFELPADEVFNPDLLRINVVNAVDSFFIINGVTYNGMDIYCEGDSTGKGCDHYVYEDGELEHI